MMRNDSFNAIAELLGRLQVLARSFAIKAGIMIGCVAKKRRIAVRVVKVVPARMIKTAVGSLA